MKRPRRTVEVANKIRSLGPNLCEGGRPQPLAALVSAVRSSPPHPRRNVDCRALDVCRSVDETSQRGPNGRERQAAGAGRWYPWRMDRDEVIRVLRAFEEVGLEYVLIGAAAMGIHGVVRATEDLDLFIRATPDNVERLKRALRQTYDNDPNIDEISADDLLGEYPALRYYPPSGDLYFDVMTRLGEAASFESVKSMVKEVDGIQVRLATPQALFELKRGTARPLDHRDAEALRQRFGLGDD